MRINKYLSLCNLGSRRKVEDFIKQGDVRVNGKIVTDLACNIEPDQDVVEYKGNKISPIKEKYYIMLNKPKKYLVSTKDDFGRKTIYDLLENFDKSLKYVGRLDYMTEGLLLMSNDGDFVEKVIHPRYKLPKVYKVVAKGRISNEQSDKLRNGVLIDGRKTLPAKVYIKSNLDNKSIVKITIFEGRKRQVRRMFKAIGSEVLELKRLQVGELKLGKLPIGMWRFLNYNEIKKLINWGIK